MNFLKKARQKAESAMKEIQDKQSQFSQSTAQPPTPQQNQQASPQPQVYAQPGYSSAPTPQQYQYPPVQAQQSFYQPPPSHQQYQQYQQPPPPEQVYQSSPPVHQTYNPVPPQNYSNHPQQFQQQNAQPPPAQRSFNSNTQQTSPLKCLGRDHCLTKYTQFYCLKATDEFSVCSNCFSSRVAPYPGIAANFVPFHSEDKNKKLACDFFYPGVQYLFRNQCIPRNTVQPLLNFTNMFLDGTMISCDGSQVPGPGYIYMTKGDAISGLGCCRTCFELNLRHTPFEGQFELRGYPEGQSWSCDVVLDSYKGMLVSELGKPAPDFRHFSAEANARMQAPECPGPGNPILRGDGESRCAVFTSTGGKSGNICKACYYDHLANTVLADRFVLVYLSEEQIGSIHCDLGTAQSKSAIGIAVKRGSDDVWRDSIMVADVAGACPGLHGVDESDLFNIDRSTGSAADWYQVTDFPAVEVCPRCYHLQVKLLGAAHLFSPITRPLANRVIRMCFLTNSAVPFDVSTADPTAFESTLAWRSRRLMNTMDLGYEEGDWSDFMAVCQEISTLPPPCGGRARGFWKGSGRKFLGHVYADPNDPDDLTMVICEECHSRFIKDTPLAPRFSQDLTRETWDTTLPGGFECLLYSPRLKQNLKDCAARNDLVGFARYWNLRIAIGKRRIAWKPILAEQKIKQDAHNKVLGLQAMMAVNAQANALMMKGGASFAEAAMGETGVRYGNSTVGMNHLSAAGANAAMAFHNASAMPDVSSSGNVVADSKIFLARFEQDEKAWLEVE